MRASPHAVQAAVNSERNYQDAKGARAHGEPVPPLRFITQEDMDRGMANTHEMPL